MPFNILEAPTINDQTIQSINKAIMPKPCIYEKDKYSDDKNYYIKKMTERDTRSWFRMRSRITLIIKANRSFTFRDNMGCRQCDTRST